jgi:hypothetical protein
MPVSHITKNVSNEQQDNRLYLLQPGGVKTPVKFDIFKHGGGIYLALVNHDQSIHIPLMGNAWAVKLELQGALYRIEVATETNDQGYLSGVKDGAR